MYLLPVHDNGLLEYYAETRSTASPKKSLKTFVAEDNIPYFFKVEPTFITKLFYKSALMKDLYGLDRLIIVLRIKSQSGDQYEYF
jgi:hypothetical protein